MAWFESRYKSAAGLLLSRDIRKLEELEAAGVSERELAAVASAISANIAFANNLALISALQAEAYRVRIDALNLERDTHCLDDGYENAIERSIRFRSLDDYRLEVSNMGGGLPPRDAPGAKPDIPLENAYTAPERAH